MPSGHQLLELRGRVLEIPVARTVRLRHRARAIPCRGRPCRRRPGRARLRRETLRCPRTCRRSSRSARRRRAPWRCRPSSGCRHRRSPARRVPSSALATREIALICGTPTPATMRVVQIDPGPMPTLTRVGSVLRRDRARPRRSRCCRRSPGYPAYCFLILRDRLEHAARMAMRGVDHDHVDARFAQGAPRARGCRARCPPRRRRAGCRPRPCRRSEIRWPSGSP